MNEEALAHGGAVAQKTDKQNVMGSEDHFIINHQIN